MKKEIIKKSVMLIVLTGLLMWCANLNATEKVTRNYEMKKDNQISIMVYDEETEDYVAQDTVPTGCKLDKEKTYCVNGGEITSYDSATGVINYNLNTDDKCYVYLKQKPMPELCLCVQGFPSTDACTKDRCIQQDTSFMVMGAVFLKYYFNGDGEVTISIEGDSSLDIVPYHMGQEYGYSIANSHGYIGPINIILKSAETENFRVAEFIIEGEIRNDAGGS